MGLLDSVGGFFSNSVPSFFSGALDTAKSVVNQLHTDAVGAAGAVFSIPKAIISLGGGIVNKAEDVIGNTAGKGLDVINNVGGKAVDVVGTVGGKAVDAVGTVGGKVADAAGDAAKGLTSFLGSPMFLILAAGGAYIFLNSGVGKKALS